MPQSPIKKPILPEIPLSSRIPKPPIAAIIPEQPIPALIIKPPTPALIPDLFVKCSTCGQNTNNIIYVCGYGYLTYCSPFCFRQTQ